MNNTPIEELIETLETYRNDLISGEQKDLNDTKDIEYAISTAKKFLKKEKIALKKHFSDGKAENFNKPEDYLPKSAEEHFNEKYGKLVV